MAVSPSVLLSLEERGHGGQCSWCARASASSASSSSTSTAFQVGMLFKFVQWRSITSNRFVPNMVWGQDLQHKSHPPLFHDFLQFNVKVAAAHHPLISEGVDEPLAKGAVEPSLGGAGFYSSRFVVLCILGTSDPYLTWSVLIIIIHIPSLRCQLLNMYGRLSSMVIMLFPLIYRMLIYIFLLLSILLLGIIVIFLHFVWHNVPYQWKVLTFGLATAPRGFYFPHQTYFVPLPLQGFAYCYLFGWHLGPHSL